MASTTIKSTYSLDVKSVRALEAMARRWKVSKSEALRRAIRAAAEQESPEALDAIAALEKLQTSLDLTNVAALRWEKANRAERNASSRDAKT